MNDAVLAGREWLPDPAEIVDSPERRDEPPDGVRLRAQAGWGGDSPAVRRVWWSDDGRTLEEAAVWSGSGRGARDARDGGALFRAGGLRIGAGALAAPEFGLTGETSSLTRRLRGTGGGSETAARLAPMRVSPGSGADLDGLALGWRGAARIMVGRLRRSEGDALALEVRDRGIAARGVFVRRADRMVSYGGLSVASHGPEERVGVDLSAGDAGVAARVDASGRAGPFRGAAGWRYERGRERPGTLDLEASWRSRAASARFRWRSWGAGASIEAPSTSTARGGSDDGRAELDVRAGRGAGALLVRVGSRPRQADGTGGERFAIADLLVAREAGRSLRLTAGDRRTQAGDGWRRGRAVGAVLELERQRRRRASLTVTAEMVRAEAGAGAYGQGFDVAGGGSIRARTRSGFRAAARGWIGLGGWRFGATVDDEESGSDEDTTAGEPRAPRVNLWLAWSGGTDAR